MKNYPATLGALPIPQHTDLFPRRSGTGDVPSHVHFTRSNDVILASDILVHRLHRKEQRSPLGDSLEGKGVSAMMCVSEGYLGSTTGHGICLGTGSCSSLAAKAQLDVRILLAHEVPVGQSLPAEHGDGKGAHQCLSRRCLPRGCWARTFYTGSTWIPCSAHPQATPSRATNTTCPACT